jgi:tripartite-type tricarboxylate transporter receptor subunit TctC
MLAPAATPRTVIDKLNAQLVTILKSTDVLDRLTAQGMEPVGSTPAQLADHIRTELAKWKKIVKLSGAKVD